MWLFTKNFVIKYVLTKVFNLTEIHNQKSQKTTKYLLKRLVNNYVRSHFRKLLLAFICMIIVASTTAINAWMMQPVLDNIFLKKDREMLIILPVAILFIAVIKGLSSYFQSILMNFIGFKIVANVQKDMLKNLTYFSLERTF